jgi:hypothetical protein
MIPEKYGRGCSRPKRQRQSDKGQKYQGVQLVARLQAMRYRVNKGQEKKVLDNRQ